MRVLLAIVLMLVASTAHGKLFGNARSSRPQQMNVYRYHAGGGQPVYYYDYRTYNFPARGRVRFSDVKRDVQAQRQFRFVFGFGKIR